MNRVGVIRVGTKMLVHIKLHAFEKDSLSNIAVDEQYTEGWNRKKENLNITGDSTIFISDSR